MATMNGIKKLTAILLLVLVAISAYAEDTTVYVTETGARFHREDCRSLRASSIPLTLSEAIRQGYTPCGICQPPTLASELYRVNVANLASYREADLSRMVPATVIRHVDGDTVHVAIEKPPLELQAVERVRMLGVDTPETVHPSRPVEHFGKEASEFTKNRLFEKPVLLAFDWDLRDRYGRLLAYIYLPDGSCHNADIIREGYGHTYTRFPFQFIEEFRALEREAREAGRGLWGDS